VFSNCNLQFMLQINAGVNLPATAILGLLLAELRAQRRIISQCGGFSLHTISSYSTPQYPAQERLFMYVEAFISRFTRHKHNAEQQSGEVSHSILSAE
jgi:hypothetical protein